jgi:hypothetical protein
VGQSSDGPNNVRDQRVLEMGPLEGHHNIILEKMGVRENIALESRVDNLRKCNRIKDKYRLDCTRLAALPGREATAICSVWVFSTTCQNQGKRLSGSTRSCPRFFSARLIPKATKAMGRFIHHRNRSGHSSPTFSP